LDVGDLAKQSCRPVKPEPLLEKRACCLSKAASQAHICTCKTDCPQGLITDVHSLEDFYPAVKTQDALPGLGATQGCSLLSRTVLVSSPSTTAALKAFDADEETLQ